MDIDGKRSAGILMHITSLPSEYGIGDLGPEAYQFAEDAKDAGVQLWQMLPLVPTGYGNSPYAGRSAFAGNELLISPDLLFMSGLLSRREMLHPEFPSDHVDFAAVSGWKIPLLRKAAERVIASKLEKKAFEAFCERESYWLDDYALFMALYEKYNDARWHTVWSEDEGQRDPYTISRIRKERRKEIEIYKALQYLFDKQIKALRSFTSSIGIRTIGDIPIYAAADSADTWSHIELFKTDSSGRYSAVSGVPPDMFSPTGQLWGNPVYNWKKHEETGFQWWIERIRRCLSMTDIIRIDHFRGFAEYYEIKAGASTAENGVWKKSPGKKLFETLKSKLGTLPIIAEDLEILRKRLIKSMDSTGDIKVVGESSTGKGIIEIAKQTPFDIAVLDIEMESAEAGLDAAKAILEERPDAKIIILTLHDSDEMVFSAIEKGAVDYVIKSGDTEEVIQHIRNAYSGKRAMDWKIQDKLQKEFRRLRKSENDLLFFIRHIAVLTPAEKALLKLLVDGYSIREISRLRFVEVSTVKTQISHILKKLNAKRTREIVVQIKEMKLEELLSDSEKYDG